ncbi:nucleotidyltransferase domain-containing protein [Geminocystis herdmanii]|uniref:nucleotidyltransferase domain-containing protein n=1 Tax=Geminocystis herdmanii TaxID=669359 RepID=UPI00034DB543|nr:nucleotidyltransferase domain-containing protein [Geminocystis herdmanii]
MLESSIKNTVNLIEPSLRRFEKSLRYLYGKDIDKIILFGSQARGEATIDSDVDILVVTKAKLTEQKRDELIREISDFSINENILFNVIEMLTTRFELEQSPLLINIRREGIVL